MKFTRLVALLSIAALLFLAGCAASMNSVYSVPARRTLGWKEKPQTLTVIFSNPFVSESIGDDGNYAPDFSEWLGIRLQVKLKEITGIAPEIRVVDENYFNVVQEKAYDADLWIPYPKEGANDSLHGLVLSINHIVFYRNIDPCANENVCTTNRFPVMKGAYSYMDASTRKVYGSGEFYVEDEILPNKESGDWETAVDVMVNQILWFTPLKK